MTEKDFHCPSLEIDENGQSVCGKARVIAAVAEGYGASLDLTCTSKDQEDYLEVLRGNLQPVQAKHIPLQGSPQSVTRCPRVWEGASFNRNPENQ